MVRVGGLSYSCNPVAKAGQRIGDMRLKGQLIDAGKKYKVAGWAPVAEEARSQGNKQVWEVVETWLKSPGRSHQAAPTQYAQNHGRIAQQGLRRLTSACSATRRCTY
jgi:hypothetical protein